MVPQDSDDDRTSNVSGSRYAKLSSHFVKQLGLRDSVGERGRFITTYIYLRKSIPCDEDDKLSL